MRLYHYSKIKENHMSIPGEREAWPGIPASLLAVWGQVCVSVHETIQAFS